MKPRFLSHWLSSLLCVGALTACTTDPPQTDSGTDTGTADQGSDIGTQDGSSMDVQTDIAVDSVRPDVVLDATSDGSSGTCRANELMCSGQCVNGQIDRANCGMCGRACRAGEICNMGMCEVNCPMGQRACGTQCVDTNTDRLNCGDCNQPCPSGQVCGMGMCMATCVMGTTACTTPATDGGAGALMYCANTNNDRFNCGTCGRTCADGEACVNGNCVLSCTSSQSMCNGRCVTLSNDALNCGTCGRICGTNEVCTNSNCVLSCGTRALCPATTTEAGMRAAYCADTTIDNQNCGACGRACGPSESCVNGVCGLHVQQGTIISPAGMTCRVAPAYQGDPIATDSTGRLWVAMLCGSTGATQLMVASSTDGGSTFSAPVSVGALGGAYALASPAAGTILAFGSNSTQGIVMSLSTNSGTNWTPFAQIQAGETASSMTALVASTRVMLGYEVVGSTTKMRVISNPSSGVGAFTSGLGYPGTWSAANNTGMKLVWFPSANNVYLPVDAVNFLFLGQNNGGNWLPNPSTIAPMNLTFSDYAVIGGDIYAAGNNTTGNVVRFNPSLSTTIAQMTGFEQTVERSVTTDPAGALYVGGAYANGVMAVQRVAAGGTTPAAPRLFGVDGRGVNLFATANNRVLAVWTQTTLSSTVVRSLVLTP